MSDEHQDDHQPITGVLSQEIDPGLRKIFEATVKYEASDLILKPELAPRIRLRGNLKSLQTDPYDFNEFERVITTLMSDEQAKHYKRHGSIDMAYDHGDDNRFRINIFRARGRSALAARRVSSEILDFEQLHLPPIMGKIAEKRQGLVLLCGVTGSGKSTTIASMLQHINENRPCHIVTIEDPIEYIFKDAKAMVNQREIGVDAANFPEALRALVRENPDVVLIGEMRDRVTFQAALQAAETGHLVFGTIHASSAPQAFTRLYDLFAIDERDLIRNMLAYTLQAIIYQKLLPCLRDEIDRVPAVEVLLNNPVVSNYITGERENELGDIIRQNTQEGMLDFNDSLVGLVEKEYIHPREAVAAAHNAEELRMRLKGISTSQG